MSDYTYKIRRLSVTKNIDAKTVGVTNLYTVPTGRIAIITSAKVRCTTATAITVAPTLGIGIAANEDDIFASVALTGFINVNNVWSFIANGNYRNALSTNVIKLGIDVGSTGTTHTIEVDLFGYLL